MRDGTVVAEYLDPEEARLARHALAGAGVEAWLEGPDGEDELAGSSLGRIRLVVPAEAADEALDVLAELDEGAATARRPLWIPVVAAVVAAGLIWAAVPRFLWPWLLFGGFVTFLLWRAVAPRRP
ncbi:MAG TPA: hypothetical protein VHH92_07270 [Actinomycetota bacterium]|nr:hypothetical protein [Actinomycetota bacterium]